MILFSAPLGVSKYNHQFTGGYDWWRYRVLIEFPRGGFTCPLGGFNRVLGGFKFQRGFKVNDWDVSINWNLAMFFQSYQQLIIWF